MKVCKIESMFCIPCALFDKYDRAPILSPSLVAIRGLREGVKERGF